MSIGITQALSIRSDHSLGESTLQVSTLVEQAKELGYDTLGITDTMSISALVEFSNKCRKEGIKPVIGCVIRVVDDPKYRKPKGDEVVKKNHSYQLKVYIKSDAGLRSLMKLLTIGNSEEYFYYVSRVGLREVIALEDVVVTTGDVFNLYHHPHHQKILSVLKNRFKDCLFSEIVPINTPLFDTLNTLALNACEEFDIPPIMGYPVFYASEDDANSLDVLRAITSNNKMDSRTLPKPYVRDMCLHKPEMMLDKLSMTMKTCELTIKSFNDALVNMGKLAERCNYSFRKLEPSLPKMAENEFVTMVQECKLGWDKRFSKEVLGHKPTDLKIYKERLAYELSVIKKLGFSDYFLLVQNIVKWSKDNGIIIGPGRGSVGGSLIAYLLGITDVDPIRFNLLFERFINADRTDLPDADLDFMSSRRHEVVQYIINHFGKENVAGISNYSTLGTASSIRDVSRVHNLEMFEYSCSKQVEKEHGVSLSLEESASAVPDIQKYKDKYPDLWKHATKLEGCLRNLGQHAAGVIVAGEPIINRAVVKKAIEGGLPVVYWDKQVVEDWGLIKMDILGLSTLDILKLAADYIKERNDIDIDYLAIPLEEEDVMAAFGRGETIGVFQFESQGMRRLLKDLASLSPLTFEDITAATALYRPGPIDAGLVDQFVAVKQGMKAPEYDHPLLESALKNTYGVLTYQEQIMQAVRDLAGFTMVEADHVRKAMGKKDRDKMAEYSELFVTGAVKSGMSEYGATILWDKIAGFAGYCFNRSHSVEYSVISYWCMWLKVRFPAEFYAAAMTVIDKDDKLTSLMTDAKSRGIKIMPPDINHSSARIEIHGDNELYAPFQAVKGISANVANHIMKVKAHFGKPFTSRLDFDVAATESGVAGKINVSHKDKLERVGAFASITEGSLPPLHPSRLKDRIELMAGFTVDLVKADRGIASDRLAKIKIVSMISEIQECAGCSLKDSDHPSPRLGKTPKFMMVFDSPTYHEGKDGKMLEGDIGAYVKAALKEVGLSVNDGYFTTLVKAVKSKGAKGLSNEQINGCSNYLKREIEALKPPVIIAMGANAVRYFVPSIKGAPGDYSGKVIFDPELDASIILGVNPSSLHFDPSKIILVQNVCSTLSTLIID